MVFSWEIELEVVEKGFFVELILNMLLYWFKKLILVIVILIELVLVLLVNGLDDKVVFIVFLLV